MLDQQEPVQDPQIDEVEAEVQDAKSSDMPLWVWIVGGVVAIAAIVLIICGAKGVFSADSDADKLANVQAEEIKRNDQTQTSVDESQQRPEGVVASKPLETETTVKETVGTEATESGWSPLSKLLGLGLTGTATAWYSGWFSSADKPTGEEDVEPLVDGEGPLVDGEKPLVDGEDSSVASAGWVTKLVTMATEHPYVSLGAIAVLGVTAYKLVWCSKKTAKGSLKKRNFIFNGDNVTVKELSEEDARRLLQGPTERLTFAEDTVYVQITTEAGQSQVVLKEDPLLVEAVTPQGTAPGQQTQLTITAGATDDTDAHNDSAQSGNSQRAQPTTGGEPSPASGAHTPIRTQTSLASTLSTQSGATGADATPATPIAGAPALDNVLSNASTQSGHSGGSINRMHTTMNPSGLGEAPSLFHQGSRHSLSAGERPVTLPTAPPAPINFVRKDSDHSGRIVLGDNASTQSQSGRPSVVSPIAGALGLDSVDLQGEDSAGVQCAEGSVVKRGPVYYSVGMDGMSLTQISDSPMSGRRSQVVLQLEQRDLQHILEVGQVTYRGGDYTFAGHHIHRIEVTAGKHVKGGCCSAGVVEDPTYHVTLTQAAREEPSYTMHGDAPTSDGQDHHVELKETRINITELEPFQE